MKATLCIGITSQDQLDLILKAEELLGKAGVCFDTGTNVGVREWEFDWSLKGAKLVIGTGFDMEELNER